MKSDSNLVLKYFDRHIFNKVMPIKNFESLPKKFKQNVFSKNTGERYFNDYLSRGDFFGIKGKDKFYLVWMSPDEIKIVDQDDRLRSESEIEWDLNLPILGFTLTEFLEKYKEIKDKKIAESFLKKIITKVLKEQSQTQQKISISNHISKIKNAVGTSGNFSKNRKSVDLKNGNKVLSLQIPSLRLSGPGTWRIDGTNIIFSETD